MSKRGNGEGSIYQMSDGRWRAAVSIGWEKGKFKRKTITGHTRNDVASRLNKLLHDQDRGLNIDPEKQTTGAYLDAWLEHTARPSIRPKTYSSYEQMIRVHLNKRLSAEECAKKKLDDVAGLHAIPLAKLSMQVVQKWMNQKLKAGNSPRLVAYLRVVLRAALGQAVKADLIPRNPAALARPPRVENHEVKPFSQGEAGRFLKAAKGHRLEALFTCAVAVGLRSGEAAALRWKTDVNLPEGTITVNHSLQRQKGAGLVLIPPKSSKGRRTIELPAVCVTALARHRERQAAERVLAGTAWVETGHVFTSGIGTPIDCGKILAEFGKLLKAAGLQKQRFHDLRHAAISLLAAQGVPLKVIAEIVGHSDIRLTQNVYQHVFQPAKKEAAEKMNRLLTGLANELDLVATPVATKSTAMPPN